MNIFFRCLVAISFLGPAHAQSERPLKHFRVGDALRSDEIISIGPRAVRLPQANWHLIAIHQGENRAGQARADVTTGVFA